MTGCRLAPGIPYRSRPYTVTSLFGHVPIPVTSPSLSRPQVAEQLPPDVDAFNNPLGSAYDPAQR